MAAKKEMMAINYIDFDHFKAALVRIAILAADTLGGQGLKELQRQVELEAKRRSVEER